MSAARENEDYHQAMTEHVGHDIEITKVEDNTFLACHTCIPREEYKKGFLFFKTWRRVARPVAFLIHRRKQD